MPKGVYIRKKEPWNKGRELKPLSIEHKKKISVALRQEKSPEWKGEKAGYFAKHIWLCKYFDKKGVCSHYRTKTAKKYEWANISGEYRRNIDDYVELCTSCHRKMDYKKKPYKRKAL